MKKKYLVVKTLHKPITLVVVSAGKKKKKKSDRDAIFYVSEWITRRYREIEIIVYDEMQVCYEREI